MANHNWELFIFLGHMHSVAGEHEQWKRLLNLNQLYNMTIVKELFKRDLVNAEPWADSMWNERRHDFHYQEVMRQTEFSVA